MKLIVILALGLGFGQWSSRRMAVLDPAIWNRSDATFQLRFSSARLRAAPILFGLGLATGGFVLAGRASRRPRSPLGVGKFAAVAVVMMYLLNTIVCFFLLWVALRREGGPMTWGGLDQLIVEQSVYMYNYQHCVMLISCVLSAAIARWLQSPRPDALEWFGRCLLAANCLLPSANLFSDNLLF